MKHLYNWNVTGHDRPIAELEKDLSSGNIAHAYLFAGPAQLGKFTAAKTMAHILQCENNYCRTCTTCREIDKGYHSDTIEIKDNCESIKIEEVREIIPRLHMSRHSNYKILLMQNIERLTAEASAAMLKTLEDPPEGVVFLFTTGTLKEILPTIISRVRVISFQRVPDHKIRDLIKNLYPHADDDLIEQVSTFAMGRPGKAVSLMRDPQLFEEIRKMYNDVCIFIKKPDIVSAFAYIADLVKSAKETGDDKPIRDFLDVFAAVLRKKMFDELGSPRSCLLRLSLLKEIQRARDLLKRNVNTRILLENLILQLC